MIMNRYTATHSRGMIAHDSARGFMKWEGNSIIGRWKPISEEGPSLVKSLARAKLEAEIGAIHLVNEQSDELKSLIKAFLARRSRERQ
jgi:hypothetical protein